MTTAGSTEPPPAEGSVESSNSHSRFPIGIDMLCKVCVLVLLGIEITSGDFVHLL